MTAMIKQERNLLITNAYLLDSERATFFAGELLLSDGLIAAIGAPGSLPRTDATCIDAKHAYLSPGLIDIHTHGRAGGDFTDADVPLLCRMSRSYLTAGVTTVMPTLASAPYNDYLLAAQRLATAATTVDGARYLGFHLEGRYLNPEKRGAHGQHLLAPLNACELTELHERMCRPYGTPPPTRISAAFELDSDGTFLEEALRLGMHPSLGHTVADFETAVSLVDRGVCCFTHLYNAMPPLHHRQGGAVAACFASGAYGEIICDGFHIAPHMVHLAYRELGRDRTVLISDSMMGTDSPDGEYHIAGVSVTVRGGKAYTADGAIAGSTIGLLEAVRNLTRFCKISLAEALLCATVNPARAAGIDNLVGSLTVGLAADILLLHQDGDQLTLSDLYVGGVSKGGMLS